MGTTNRTSGTGAPPAPIQAKPATRPTAAPPAVISACEVYDIREACRRLRWGRKTLRSAERAGLKTTTWGRIKYARGQAILDFFAELEAKQGGPADG